MVNKIENEEYLVYDFSRIVNTNSENSKYQPLLWVRYKKPNIS